MPSKTPPAFDIRAFLQSPAVTKRVVDYPAASPIFTQGDLCDSVLYIQHGRVKLSVVSEAGKAAVLGVLGPGDFFGEGALAGQPVRLASATAMIQSRILIVPKQQMIRQLHRQHALSDRFISHMLARNIRIEEDLIDQLFNSSEKRLARALLLLARYGKQEKPIRMVPRISQDTLAKMVGTTRSRINFFLNKFKKLGFIEYDGEMPVTINNSLLSVVLHD